MRLAIVSTYYRPVIGGVEASTERLAVHLARKGHHVELITRRTFADVPEREVLDGVHVHRLPPIGRRSAAGKWLWLPWLLKALLAEQYDLIFVSDPRGSAIAAWIAARRRGAPWVIEPHTEGALSGVHPGKRGAAGAINRWLTLPVRRIYARADAVAGVTMGMLDEARSLGVNESRLHYAPNPFDASVFAPVDSETRRKLRQSYGWGADDVVFLFTGRLSIEKGLRELLEAWRDVARPGWKLALAGPAMPGHAWDLGGWIAGFVRQHALESSVTLLGACAQAELAKRMAAADAAVQPSHFEAQGLAAVEAMACGLPIVASDAGGHREFIRPGVNGLLTPPRDVAALSRALVEMARIVGDPALRTQWSAAARAAVMPFEQEAVLGRFTRLLEQLAGARQGT
jgi:glycosyltransferase involved in cell wall biosynthesis